MGAVRMTSYKNRPSDHFMIVGYCLYCDKCGTFKLRKRITLNKVIPFLLAVAVVIVLTIYTNPTSSIGFGLICFFSLWLFILYPLSQVSNTNTTEYKCKRCGFAHITMENVLNYKEFDKSILDVSPQSAKVIFHDEF